MLLFLLLSVIVLTIVFACIYFCFCFYIKKHHNSKDFFTRFSDSIYYRISSFYAPHCPYSPGFSNIKSIYIAKSLWAFTYIIAISLMMYFDVFILLQSIPLFFSILTLLAEKKIRNSMLLIFKHDKAQGLADDSSYETFVKIYSTLYYYQILMTVLLLPLSVLVLYIGYIMNVI